MLFCLTISWLFGILRKLDFGSWKSNRRVVHLQPPLSSAICLHRKWQKSAVTAHRNGKLTWNEGEIRRFISQVQPVQPVQPVHHGVQMRSACGETSQRQVLQHYNLVVPSEEIARVFVQLHGLNFETKKAKTRKKAMYPG